MRHNNVILYLLIVISIGISHSIMYAQTRQISLSGTANQATLIDNSSFGFEVKFEVKNILINEVKTRGGVFDEISIEGYGFTNRIGEPKLPVLSKIIAVPVGAIITFEVVAKHRKILIGQDSRLKNRIIPAQRSVFKSEDPEKVQFEINEAAYSQDNFTENELFKFIELGYMRGVRIFQILYEPINYNPFKGELRGTSEASIQVNFDSSDLAATKELLQKTASIEFDQLYKKTLFNWQANERTIDQPYPTKMLILTPPAYVDSLQRFVTWKKQQGFTVIMTTVGTGGSIANTTNAITTYMQNIWAAATPENPAPTYLLIVGDHGDTGNNITAYLNTSEGHITDLNYARLVGTDYIPDLYYGRFSVSSYAELTNVINKTINFEKTAMPDLSYLGKTVLIAGYDSGTYDTTHENGQVNYGSTYYFNPSNGIVSDNYLAPGAANSDALIIANANEGRGFINYTAHGSETSWADPTFTTAQLNLMTNSGKYGVMVGNCCVSNAFNYASPCFGEVVIRAANKAGVAYIGATDNSLWDEDYHWAVGYKNPINGSAPVYNSVNLGAYDTMFHTHGEAFTNWAQSLADINYMGNLAVVSYNGSYTNYYWEIYSIMGDPSLMPYYGVPTVNNATYPSQILIGASSINVAATPYSRVALTMGGVLYGTALVPANGQLVLPTTAFSATGIAKLVITAQNKITIISDIPVINNTVPNLIVSSTVYTDSNNNTPEYNEAGSFNVTFQNTGFVAAANVTATMTSATTGITITDNSETIASLNAGASTTVTNAYTFNIANNIANGTSANFTITMTMSGQSPWVHNFSLVIGAPALTFGNLTISDPTGNNNGRLDPGETVTATMPLNNTGGAASPSGNVTLTCPTSGITINNSTQSFTTISANSSANIAFSVSASSGMTIGTVASLVFNATAGTYTANKTENTEVGAPQEITIGNGTSSQTYPLDRYYNYSGHEAIYLSSEIGMAGSIKSIGLYKASGTDVNTIEAVTIYMKNTTESTLATGTYSTTGYTQVYSGTFPNTSTTGWMEVNLNTMFPYNGVNNLAILIVKGYQAWISGYPYWTYTVTNTRARQNRNDDAQPTSLTATTYLPNLKLKIFPTSGVLYPPQNLTALAGNSVVNVSWQAPVSGTPTGYKIFRNSSLVTTVTGLTYHDTAVINETTYSYYLKAVYSGGESDPTTTVQATPSANPTIQIGTGTTTAQGLPIEPFYGYTYSQSIYLQTEINVPDSRITKLQWYYNGNSAWTDAVRIYMGHTGLTSFASTSSWINPSNLTLVYDGNLTVPSSAGWVEITLTAPFQYNNLNNLVIAIDENTTGYHSSSDEFYCSAVTGTRSIHYYNDTTNPDPASPPTLGTYLYTKSYIPNVKLTFQPIILEAVFLNGTFSAQGMVLNWNPIPNAAYYFIYRSPEPNGTYYQIGTTTEAHYLDANMFSKAFYYIKAVSN